MNYKKYCDICDQFLRENKHNLFLNSISAAHVIRKHPELNNKKDQKVRSSLKYNLRKIYKLLYIFFCNRNFYITQNSNLKKKDVIVLSHLINKSHLKNKNDFYFGNLTNFLSQHNISSYTVLRNFAEVDLDKINKKNLEDKIVINNFYKLFFELYFIFLFFFNYIFFNIKNIFSTKIKKKIYFKIVSLNSLKSSFSNIRLAYQVSYLCKYIKPKVIFITYEGHAWERVLIKNIKDKFKDKVKIAAYQFSVLNSSTHSIFKKRNYNYDPDFILCCGKVSRKFFLEKGKFKKNKIIDIGSHKSIQTNRRVKKTKNNILVLPEGFLQETKLLIDFVNKIAIKNINFNFIIRIHPMLNINLLFKASKKNAKNVIFSKNFDILNDFERSNYIFYRGSGSVFQGILNDLHPVYIEDNRSNIDPLFFIKKRSKLHIEQTDINLSYFFNNEKKKTKDIYFAAKEFYRKSDFKEMYNKLF